MKHLFNIMMLIVTAVVMLTSTGCQTDPSAAKMKELGLKSKKLSSFKVVISGEGNTYNHYRKIKNGKVVVTKDLEKNAFSPDTPIWIIKDYEKQLMYSYDPKSNIYVKAELDENIEKVPLPCPVILSIPLADDLDTSYGKFREEKVDGVDCLVFEVNAAGSKTEYCYDVKYGLPVKVVKMETPVTLKYDQINAVPDKEFEIPKNAKMQDATILFK